jgi:hypothetical protein
MNISEEAILTYWKEHREQLRQSETQRSTLTNFLLVITAALSALIVHQGFSGGAMPLCVFIIVLGVYGALTVAKYYERASYHLSQARALTSTLVSMGCLGPEEELDKSRADHYRRFPRLHRLRLHHLWVVLHFGTSLYGTALLIACLVARQ